MRAAIALIFLAIAWHPLAGIAIGTTAYLGGHLTATLTIAAVVLLARHAPRHSHPIIAALIGAGIATLITGHAPPAGPAPQALPRRPPDPRQPLIIPEGDPPP